MNRKPPLLRRLGLDRHSIRALVDRHNSEHRHTDKVLHHTDECKRKNRERRHGELNEPLPHGFTGYVAFSAFVCSCDFFERIRAIIRPKRDDLPEGFLAFLDDDASMYCRECVTLPQLKKSERENPSPEGLSQPTATVALASDDWFTGGECANCGEMIYPPSSLR